MVARPCFEEIAPPTPLCVAFDSDRASSLVTTGKTKGRGGRFGLLAKILQLAFQRARYSVEELLDQARNRTRKLTARERKLAIEALDSEGRRPKPLNELVGLFGVSRTQITRDRLALHRKAGDSLSASDASQIVAEYLRDLDRQIENIQSLLDQTGDDAAVVAGSLVHVNYEKLLADLRERRIAKLQEIGVVPKELGRLNVREEVWKAVVAEDSGIITTSSLEAGESAEHMENT